ncbi:hypothetical protein RQP46_007541 [Phenoliferia psychrophenolica]
MKSLPIELLADIFEACGQGDLARHALVCRTWWKPAQQALFGIVELGGEASARAWLRSPARARHTTRTLELDVSSGSYLSTGTAAKVLQACPYLRSLSVNSANPDNMYAWSSSAPSSSLQSLAIGWPEFFPMDADHPPLTHRLRRLTLNAGDQIDPRQIHQILISSKETLVQLELTSARSGTTLTRLADFFTLEVFANVRSLVLVNADAYSSWPALIASLPNLTSLEVRHLYGQEGITAVGLSATTGIEDLSLSMRSFYEPSTLKKLRNMIKLPNLAGLRRLRLNLVGASWAAFDEPVGRALRKECEKRDIRISY